MSGWLLAPVPIAALRTTQPTPVAFPATALADAQPKRVWRPALQPGGLRAPQLLRGGFSPNMTLAGTAVRYQGPGADWDAGCYTVERPTNTATLTATLSAAAGAPHSNAAMLMLDPQPNTAPTGRYILYVQVNGRLNARLDGVDVAPFASGLGPWALGDSLAIDYDGTRVAFLRNGVGLHSAGAPGGQALHGNISLTPGASLIDIGFGRPGLAGLVADLGRDRQIDTVALLFHTALAGGRWTLWSRTGAQGDFPPSMDVAGASLRFIDQPVRSPGEGFARVHAVAALPAAFTARYLRLEFADAAGVVPWSAGCLLAGQRIEPAWGVDWGGGARVEDQSVIRTLPDGAGAVMAGARVPVIRAPFKSLTDAEWGRLWEVIRRHGESAPLLFARDAARQDAIHYGTLAGLDFNERTLADKQAWELRLREWL